MYASCATNKLSGDIYSQLLLSIQSLTNYLFNHSLKYYLLFKETYYTKRCE